LDSWQPISIDELERLVARQLLACTPEQQKAFAGYRVPFFPIPIARLGSIEQVLVVAKMPQGLLFFEDVEEGFQIAVPDERGVIQDYSTDQFDLSHVLTRAGL